MDVFMLVTGSVALFTFATNALTYRYPGVIFLWVVTNWLLADCGKYNFDLGNDSYIKLYEVHTIRIFDR